MFFYFQNFLEPLVMLYTLTIVIQKSEEKSMVDEGFVNTWARTMCNLRSSPKVFEDYKLPIKAMLREIDVEIIKK